jgi:phosphatidylserine/phosphatidylglycerophosphate/cardiolipin synthase-like enzyme
MLSVSSTAEAAAAMRGAHTVSFTAYTLRRGALFDALEAAAHGGARVSVRLEGAPYRDADGSFARVNAGVVADLRRAGVDASVSAPANAPIHAKILDVDGTRYLDDRNFGAGDLVVRDDDPADPTLATLKRDALAAEGKLLRAAAPGEDAIVESESFGCCNAVYSALDDAAKRGLQPRVLVCARELRGNDRERDRLAHLAADGARVRVTNEADKIALAGDRLWIGSANATAAIELPDTIDWGVSSDDAAIVAAARARVESTWARAKAL